MVNTKDGTLDNTLKSDLLKLVHTAAKHVLSYLSKFCFLKSNENKSRGFHQRFGTKPAYNFDQPKPVPETIYGI